MIDWREGEVLSPSHCLQVLCTAFVGNEMELNSKMGGKEMIRVICCMCRELVMLKPGNCEHDSHSFCQACLDEYCRDNGLGPIEIFIPKGAITNEEKFPRKVSHHND